MTKYKPGDKVLVVDNFGHFFKLGEVVTLVGRDPEYDYEGSLAWDCKGIHCNQTLLEKEFELM